MIPYPLFPSLQLSIDKGRVSVEVPEGDKVRLKSIILGAGEAAINASTFTGCLRDLVVNAYSANLSEVISMPQNTPFTYNQEGVVAGCGSGALCTGHPCSTTNSMCTKIWQDHVCVCPSLAPSVIGGQCVDPCQPNPCRNTGTCSPATPWLSNPFTCQCGNTYSGSRCEVQGCGSGLFRDGLSPCQRCRCNPVGVTGGICDGMTGACFCNVSS